MTTLIIIATAIGLLGLGGFIGWNAYIARTAPKPAAPPAPEVEAAELRAGDVSIPGAVLHFPAGMTGEAVAEYAKALADQHDTPVVMVERPGEQRDPEQQRVHEEMANQIAELNRALDEKRPAPDPIQLAHHLQAVWTRMVGTDIDGRFHAMAETAIDYTRGLWPAADTAAGGGSAGAELPVAPSPTGATPGGGPITIAEAIAAAEQDTDVVEFSRHGDFTVPTIRLAAIMAAGQIPKMMRELHWAGIGPIQVPILRGARAVLDAGYRRLPARDALATLLAAHDLAEAVAILPDLSEAPAGIAVESECSCGWSGLPIHHVDHVAEQVLDALTAAGATR